MTVTSTLLKESAQPTEHVRRHFSKGFKLFLLAASSVLLLTGSIFTINAAQKHAQVDHLAKNQLFNVLKDIAGGTPMVYATDLSTTDQPLATISFPVHGEKRFVMQVAGKDGYVWRYDSETGRGAGSCTNLGCWIGLPVTS